MQFMLLKKQILKNFLFITNILGHPKSQEVGFLIFSNLKSIQKFLLLRSKTIKNILDILGKRHRTNIFPMAY